MAVVFLLSVGVVACGSSVLSGTISVAGSLSVQPLIEELGAAFVVQHPNVQINVQGGGSTLGIQSVGEGTADVGMASRSIEPSELVAYSNLQTHTIAWAPYVVIVHPDVSVDDLTLNQLRDILAGQVVNWSQVGGDDAAITVFNQPEGTCSRSAIVRTVVNDMPLLESDPVVWGSGRSVLADSLVRQTPGSISYTPLGTEGQTKVLAIDRVGATPENVASGAYPIRLPLNLVTNGEPTGAVKAWLDFILSEEGRETIADWGGVPVR